MFSSVFQLLKHKHCFSFLTSRENTSHHKSHCAILKPSPLVTLCCVSSVSLLHLSLSPPCSHLISTHSHLPYHFPRPCSVPRSCSSSRQLPYHIYAFSCQPSSRVHSLRGESCALVLRGQATPPRYDGTWELLP